MVQSCGLAARGQAMKRHYALLLRTGNKAGVVKALAGNTILAETDFPLQFGNSYELNLRVVGNRIQAGIDGTVVFDIQDTDRPLREGALALVCEEGRMAAQWVRVQPSL